MNFKLLRFLLLTLFSLMGSGLVAQEALLNNTYRNQTCELICLQDLVGYNLGIAMLSHALPGDSAAQVKYFYDNYAYELTCPQKIELNGTDLCTHTGLNFLQTAIMDRADIIVSFVITQTNYDPNHRLSTGKSTIEWLQGLVDSPDYHGSPSKQYLGKVLTLMKQVAEIKK